MSKSLVIVESPAKAKTISKYLGPNYIVESSVGHIRDLPKKASSDVKRFTTPKNISPEEKARLKSINERKRLIRRMGIDPDNGWEAVWQIIPEKEKVIKNSPFKKTIAHGYYSLSLIPKFVNEIWECKNLKLILLPR